MDLKISPDGVVHSRESSTTEFKEIFPHANEHKSILYDCVKTIAAFSNHKGGVVYFGIKDRPVTLVGATRFNFDQVSNTCKEHLEPHVELTTFEKEIDGKKIYCVQVAESQNKPVICKKEATVQTGNKPNSILRSGAIYYRYNSSSREIDYSELNQIINSRIKSEHKAFLQGIELIVKRGGPKQVVIGTVEEDAKVKNLYLTEEAAKNINFIREGRFEEKQDLSFPAYKIVSNVKVNVVPDNQIIMGNINTTHTYNFTSFGAALGISGAYISGLVWYFKLDQRPELYIKETVGKQVLHRLSAQAITYVKDEMRGKDMTAEAKTIQKAYISSRNPVTKLVVKRR